MNLGLELALVLNEPWLQKSSPSIRKPLIYLGLEIDPERPIHIQVLPGPNTLSAYSGADVLRVGALWGEGVSSPSETLFLQPVPGPRDHKHWWPTSEH